MLLLPSGWAVVVFGVISVVTGVDLVSDLRDEPLQLNWNMALDLVVMFGAAVSAAFGTVQYLREWRLHEEMRRTVLASLPDDPHDPRPA